jgi:hypothetical protein
MRFADEKYVGYEDLIFSVDGKRGKEKKKKTENE